MTEKHVEYDISNCMICPFYEDYYREDDETENDSRCNNPLAGDPFEFIHTGEGVFPENCGWKTVTK